ncbi:DUF2189 domain-containing protein [Oceanibium sediminis]|uniref:DUF2189 domain-containing protein n=1 Tax=Oceanibium sediminis TaxID=2026339 RepID=UPI000DD4DA16|nr:DUF2189 domain-containing protein [Oceanibium sediminis]
MNQTAAPDRAPEIGTITQQDLRAALAAGWRDFRAAPVFGLAIGAVFSVIGIVIYLQLAVWGSSYWALPLMAGFPLIGPFAAVGLYEVSRQLEAGGKPDAARVLSVILGESRRQIPSLAFVALFLFLFWVYMAHLIFALSFGLKPLTNILSSTDLLMTTEGATMLITGTLVGGALAGLLFAITVISVPMLVEREIDVVTAMVTSFQAVAENPRVMLTWGAIIAVLSALAMAPFFLGMLVIFPVLGHASWHLYRRVVTAPAEDASGGDI